MKTYTTYFTSPLGPLKIACSEEWVTAVEFLADDEAMDQTGEHYLLQLCKEQLGEYFSGSGKMFNLPIQQSGTTFQQKVWELLVQIPYGKTISYNDLSRQYGDV